MQETICRRRNKNAELQKFEAVRVHHAANAPSVCDLGIQKTCWQKHNIMTMLSEISVRKSPVV